MKSKFSFLLVVAFSFQVFEDTQASDRTALYMREQSRELQAVDYGDDSQSNTPVGTPATENFYQEIYDAFIKVSEQNDRASALFNRYAVDSNGKKQQNRQKTFLLGVLYQATADIEFYRSNSEGCSYFSDAIQERHTLRQAIHYREDTQEEKTKTNTFKALLEIDKAQDDNPNDATIKMAINTALVNIRGCPEKTVLENWCAAIDKELVYEQLKNATSVNLSRTWEERAVPFLIIVPVSLYVINLLVASEQNNTVVTEQQNHTISFLELINFTTKFNDTLFSVPHCFQINNDNMCNITRFTIENEPKTNPYISYVVPVIVLTVGVVKFAHKMIHEIFYMIFQYRDRLPYSKYKSKNIELVDDEITDTTYVNIRSNDSELDMTTLSRVKEFLPGLLKKRTWGFTKTLQDRIEQTKK